MPKKENAAFLIGLLQPLPKFPAHVYDAMLTWLFGSDERSVAVCAVKAYRDVQRNLSGIRKMPEQDKGAWKDDTERLIVGCIEDLFTRKVVGLEEFDAWHNEVCVSICEASNNHDVPKWIDWMQNGYTYGLAQKILNMTIKNMLIMEAWNEYLEPLKEFLHVPVDSYVMEAAFEQLGIAIPRKSGGRGKYSLTGSKSGSKPWSRWKYNDYTEFQNELRKAVPCPIEWEFEAWNKMRAKWHKT